ncbi:MAG TPA: hypothetical protein PLF92_14505, partial [Arenimonas sp.]|nr:hypothetical protein [Arenimonas sp.]
QQVNGEHSLKMHSDELAELSRLTVLAQFRLACLVLASGFLICAALFYLFDTQSPVYFHLNAKTWVALGAGVFAMLAAWFKRA